MRILSHWQWLVINKGAKASLAGNQTLGAYGLTFFYPGYLGLKDPMAGYPTKLTFLGKFNTEGKANSLVVSHGSSWPKLPLRSSKRFRTLRKLDHSFLTKGLLRFGEELSGSAFSLLILKNLLATASPQWLIEVFRLHSRLFHLFKLLRSRRYIPVSSRRHPWYGGAKIIVSSVCSRDPFLLSQWAKKRMARMRLFSHKRFLRLLGSFLRSFVRLSSSPSKILGFNLVTTGKISVTGNAMSRTMLTRFGRAGINNLSYRASSSFALIKTKTGCLGLNLVFYY